MLVLLQLAVVFVDEVVVVVNDDVVLVLVVYVAAAAPNAQLDKVLSAFEAVIEI